MFSAITLNWRGRPLETHEVVVETIAATTTKTGLSIQAALDTNTYPNGIKITDKAMKAFEAAHLQRHVPRQLELHRDGHARRQHYTPESAGTIESAQP